MKKTDAELIDEFIRNRGVTVCPPAIVAETSAQLDPAAAAAHAARGDDPIGDIWRASAVRKTGWARYWQTRREGQKR